METDTELQDAIDSAALELAGKAGIDLDEFVDKENARPNDGEVTVKVKPSTKPVEVKTDDDDDDDVDSDNEGEVNGDEEQTLGINIPEDEELTPDQKREAQILYRALLDPTKKIEVLTELAKHAGVLKEPLETKADVKAAKKTVLQLMKDNLPENMQFMAETLSPALEVILEAQRAEDRQAIAELQNKEVLNQVNRALSDLAKETKGDSRKLEPKMMALMNKYKAGPDMSPKEYLRGLYTIASGGTTAQKVKSQINEKVNKNAQDTPNRIRSIGDRGDAKVKNPGEGKKGLNNIVNSIFDDMVAGKIK